MMVLDLGARRRARSQPQGRAQHSCWTLRRSESYAHFGQGTAPLVDTAAFRKLCAFKAGRSTPGGHCGVPKVMRSQGRAQYPWWTLRCSESYAHFGRGAAPPVNTAAFRKLCAFRAGCSTPGGHCGVPKVMRTSGRAQRPWWVQGRSPSPPENLNEFLFPTGQPQVPRFKITLLI